MPQPCGTGKQPIKELAFCSSIFCREMEETPEQGGRLEWTSKLPVGIIYMFFLCRRPLVSQELKPSLALVENSYCYCYCCFVKFKATHTKVKQTKFNVTHPLHSDQPARSHFCIWIILLNLHLRPFCSLTFVLTPNMNNYPALITSIVYEHSSCKCAM